MLDVTLKSMFLATKTYTFMSSLNIHIILCAWGIIVPILQMKKPRLSHNISQTNSELFKPL